MMAIVVKVPTTPVRKVASLTLTPVNSPLQPVTLELTGAPTLAPLNPTYDEVTRPRKQSVVEWTGFSLQRQTIPCIFSGAYNGFQQDDVTSETVKLHQLACPPDRKTEPPKVRISGKTAYGIGKSDLWMVESIEPGEPRRRLSDGRVCHVEYTVTLVQFWDGREVLTAANASPAGAAAARQGAAPAPARTYTVVSGDSLSRIAQRQLGNANRWPEIQKLNNIRGTSIRAGQVLKLP